jgi:acylaminoacyl-peptidase
MLKHSLTLVWAQWLFAGLLAAPAVPDRLVPEDMFQLELVTDPQISPDGTRIVYVRRFADIQTDQRKSNLWIVNFDGTGHRPLTSGSFSDHSPRWSRDGRELIFVSDRSGTPQIHRYWLEQGQMQQLTRLTQPPESIAWSPDGKWIAFTMHVPEELPRVEGMPRPPEGAKWADPARIIDKLVYRFNGPGYLKPGYTHLFIVPAEGGTPRQLSTGNYHHGGTGFRASQPVWAPDSRAVLLSANRRDDFELEPLDTEIYEFSVPDGAIRQLTSRRGPDGQPVVSPDGNLIAYTGFDDRYQGYQLTRLYLCQRDGTQPRGMLENWDLSVSSLEWTRDGKGLLVTSDRRGVTTLFYADLQGRARELASGLGSTTSAYGGGGAVSVAENGRIALTVTSPHRPGDLAVATLDEPTPRILTGVNDDLWLTRRLGEVEEILYPSSKDGREIQGWILKPPDFDPRQKYPLILEIHGGPFANYGPRFDIEKQLMAARGYVVLYTNPRGSTSYGEEFGNLIHHAYPGDDFYDLNAGVDAMLQKGYIDPQRLYVTGGSGGGVLTCWMIGRTDRFRAAVTVYPVINWYSFVLTADIGNFVSKYWFPGLPWDHVEHYESRSLLSVVKNVKTPTMVLTGEEDYRTPMSESEQYYQALKLLGVDAVLVRVPEEPHGISRRPSHHMAKVLSILNWFDRHGK